MLTKEAVFQRIKDLCAVYSIPYTEDGIFKINGDNEVFCNDGYYSYNNYYDKNHYEILSVIEESFEYYSKVKKYADIIKIFIGGFLSEELNKDFLKLTFKKEDMYFYITLADVENIIIGKNNFIHYSFVESEMMLEKISDIIDNEIMKRKMEIEYERKDREIRTFKIEDIKFDRKVSKVLKHVRDGKDCI